MAKISVLTPHIPQRSELLPEVYGSLLEQDVDWEWLLEVEGSASLPPEIETDDRVFIERHTMPLSPENYRNLALGRSTGPFVIALDDDDLLYPQGLPQLAEWMESRPELGACIGQSFILEDDQLKPWIRYGHAREEFYPLGQDIPPGRIWEVKKEVGSHLLSSGPVFWRREELLRIGGWPAMRGSGDSLLLYQANRQKPIGHPEIPYFVYRIYEGNYSHKEAIQDLRKRNMGLQRMLLDEN